MHARPSKALPKPSVEILLHQIQIPSIQALFNETMAELEVELSRLGKLIVADAGGKLCLEAGGAKVDSIDGLSSSSQGLEKESILVAMRDQSCLAGVEKLMTTELSFLLMSL